MNAGQQQFLSFIIDRVDDDSKPVVTALLEDNFDKQAAGTFTRDDMARTQAMLAQLVRPEALEEVRAAMAHFASQMK